MPQISRQPLTSAMAQALAMRPQMRSWSWRKNERNHEETEQMVMCIYYIINIININIVYTISDDLCILLIIDLYIPSGELTCIYYIIHHWY